MASFYSFIPEFMIGMNSYFYTLQNGNLYRHNTGADRNTYYGQFSPSTITSVFSTKTYCRYKTFKTLTYESNAAWAQQVY